MRSAIAAVAALLGIAAAHAESLVVVADDVSTVRFGRTRIFADISTLTYAPYSNVPRMDVLYTGQYGEARDTAIVEDCERGVGRMSYRMDLGHYEKITYLWASKGTRPEDAVARVVCSAHQAVQKSQGKKTSL